VVALPVTRLGIEVSIAATAGTTGVTAIINLPPSVFEPTGNPLVGAVAAPAGASAAGRVQLPPPSVDQRISIEPPRPEVVPVPGPAETAEPEAAEPEAAGKSVSDDELWAMLGPPPDEAAGDHAPTVPVPTVAGLPKRVRGAQLPDLGTVSEEHADFERPAEEVRSSLASFQRGSDLGRQQSDS